MEFNSWSFVLFFPIVCLIYWQIKRQRLRNAFLLIASYYFYMCWNASYALLLLASTLVSYGTALALEATEKHSSRKWLATVGIVLNLALIAYFKYAKFGVSNVNRAMAALGIGIDIPLPEILLPVGVSFFVFQSVGYTIDVYRRAVNAERNFLNYALFISFFPQLVAGPIERSNNMLPQFRVQHTFDDDKAISGFKLMLWGYFMKLVLADRCGIYVDCVFNSHTIGYSSLIGILLFSFQLYGDFAGYTYIAIGAGRILGFKLNDNFHRPYFATTVSDFWRRWHISLSTWLRDYVYFPLGGSRCSKTRTYFNLIVTFLASGLWHGASLCYILWGGVHGVCVCLEKALGWSKKTFGKTERLIRILFTFILVAFSRTIYRAGNFGLVCYQFKRAFNPANFTFGDSDTQRSLLVILVAIILVAIKDYMEENKISTSRILGNISPWWRDVVIMTSLIVIISLMAAPVGGTFVYFQF